MSKLPRQPSDSPFPSSDSRAPTEECAWCRWPYAAHEMTSTGGQRLCTGCRSLYFGGDDEEDEEEKKR